MKIFYKRIIHSWINVLLKPLNETIITILGIYTLLWGLWIIAPWSLFNRAKLYSALQQIAPEWTWGAVAIFSGIAVLFGVSRIKYKAMVRGSIIGFYHWFAVAILYFVGDWKSTGGITSLTVAFLYGFIHLNLKANKDYVQHKKYLHDKKANDILRP